MSPSRIATAASLILPCAAFGLLAGALAACSDAGGEENLRPKVLTPAEPVQPEEVVCEAEPDVELPVTLPTGVTYVSGPPQACAGPQLMSCGIFGTPAPASGLLLSFASYQASGTWGTADGIQGGTSLYQGAPTEALTQTVMGESLNIRANLQSGGYTGIVFWFQPCINASDFAGVRFTATGSLGGTTMIVKAQTSPDYPVDVANTKGKCPFQVLANQFTECVQPFSNITALPAGEIALPWSSFSGGSPLPQVDPRQLLGFELQFQCPGGGTTPCALDLNVGTISFMPPA